MSLAATSKGNPSLQSAEMKGLAVLIADVRNCRSREAEEKRINKELGHIRQKFKEGNLSGYDRKKYVCKLLYMYILGYRIDFGHVEAVNLIASSKYKEKQVGYLAVTLLFNENSDTINLVINSFKKDLDLENDLVNSLVLSTIANVGGALFAETLGTDVFNKLTNPSATSFVKKKAALCLLKLYRKAPRTFNAQGWGEKITQLLTNHDAGVAISATSLLMELVREYPEVYATCLPRVLDRLEALVLLKREQHSSDMYYKVPSPWLQVHLLKFLRSYEPTPNDSTLVSRAGTVIQAIITGSQDIPKNQQQANTQNSILFEASYLYLQWMPTNNVIIHDLSRLLARFMTSKDSNARYLTLEIYAGMLDQSVSTETIKQQEEGVFSACRDRDVSVRRQALDVLYRMCDANNGPGVVGELVRLLTTTDDLIKDVLALKIAILSEKFAPSFEWYFQTMCDVITKAGDFCSDDIWHRVVQLVSSRPPAEQSNATSVAFRQIQDPGCHEIMVRIAAYLIGERGDSLCESAGVPPVDIFTSLHRHFLYAAPQAKWQLLTTYIKLVNLFPEIRPLAVEVFQTQMNCLDVEMQERACEYLMVLNLNNDEILAALCEEMPVFSQRLSILESRLAEKQKHKVGSGGADKSDANSHPGTPRQQVPPQARGGPASADLLGNLSASPSFVGRSTAVSGAFGMGGGSNDGGVGDLLSLSAPDYTPKHSMVAPGSNALLARFLHQRDGVLFEDATLQIGTVVEVTPGAGTVNVMLYLGNLSSSTLGNIALTFSSQPNVTITQNEVPTSIPPSAQERVSLNIVIHKVATAPLLMRMRFSASPPVPTSTDLTLRLPVLMTTFAEPINVTVDQFVDKWRTLPPPSQVATPGTVPIEDPQRIVLAQEKFANMPWLRKTLVDMKWGVTDARNDRVLLACARFPITTQIGVLFALIRLECSENGQELQLSVRTGGDPALTLHVVEAVHFLLHVSMVAAGL